MSALSLALSSSSPLTAVGSAPGRLDVLGGVADYNGSHVLQMAIAARTHVHITIPTTTTTTTTEHKHDTTTNETHTDKKQRIDTDEEQYILCASTNRDDTKILWSELSIHLTKNTLIDVLSSFRTYLLTTKYPTWTYYVFGSCLAYAYVMSWKPTYSIHIQITSQVPEGMGVSSSAAIEVSTLRALEELSLKHVAIAIASGSPPPSPSPPQFSGTLLARTAQLVENYVAGAPCGLMDQLASAYGSHGTLLPILCRPDVLYSLVALPQGVCVVGWCSGVKHSVGASPYSVARTASFMGKHILSSIVSQTWTHTTEITPSLFGQYQHLIPESMTGKEYISKYGTVEDTQSHIVDDLSYPIRAAMSFPIYENHRVQLAIPLLQSCLQQEENTQQWKNLLILIGELLYQSHVGYSAMGLGCETTDKMVAQLKELGPEQGIYGARISGGGSGGSVVVLCDSEAINLVDDLRRALPSSQNIPLIR